ncbi:MAG: hypothetical protein HY273_16055, partial [Gammaproteobacteria bacterium]|nr:hypothetical protein [Gammaproteobacteria bacterium]
MDYLAFMKIQYRVHHALTFLALVFAASVTAAADTPMAKSLRSLNSATGGQQVVTHREGGYVSHLSALSNPVPESSSLPTEARARTFFSAYRDLFLDVKTPLDLSTVQVSPVDVNGTSRVRFQQTFKGIPVRGGEAIVHLNNTGVTSVQSQLSADLSSVAVTPRITAGDAITAVRSAIKNRNKNSSASLSVPQLEIINAERLRGKQFGESRLAWVIEVIGGPDESIWVDAQSGRVILQVNRIAHVLARDVEDYKTHCDADLGTDIVSYSGNNSPSVPGEALSAWNTAEIIHNYFLT